MSKINNTKTEMNNSSQSQNLRSIKMSKKVFDDLNEGWMNNILKCEEELNEDEREEFKKYLLDKCSIEEIMIDRVEEVYNQIGSQIYDIISYIESDKEKSNWINYGVHTNFIRDEKILRSYKSSLFKDYDEWGGERERMRNEWKKQKEDNKTIKVMSDKFWEFNDSKESDLLNSITEKWSREVVMEWLEMDE